MNIGISDFSGAYYTQSRNLKSYVGTSLFIFRKHPLLVFPALNHFITLTEVYKHNFKEDLVPLVSYFTLQSCANVLEIY